MHIHVRLPSRKLESRLECHQHVSMLSKGRKAQERKAEKNISDTSALAPLVLVRSLVGLLSFMCSDDMTTGSVMATHADRCTLAQRSHAFNIKQPRFKKIFPDYCAEMPRDLPNMGEKCNKAEAAQQSPSSAVAGATEAMGPAATAASPRGSLTQSTSAGKVGLCDFAGCMSSRTDHCADWSWFSRT